MLDSISKLEELISAFGINADIYMHGYKDTSISVLLNENSSFINYFRSNEDHGFHSINLKLDKKLFEKFVLNNGQADEYPLHYLRRRNEGVECLKFYFLNGHMSPTIDWISESVWSI